MSFWLDPHAVPARVALGVTTLLTMSTQTASINSALPPVAYTKAIDVWQVCNPNYTIALLQQSQCAIIQNKVQIKEAQRLKDLKSYLISLGRILNR